jgi:hypothetical protein
MRFGVLGPLQVMAGDSGESGTVLAWIHRVNRDSSRRVDAKGAL